MTLGGVPGIPIGNGAKLSVNGNSAAAVEEEHTKYYTRDANTLAITPLLPRYYAG